MTSHWEDGRSRPGELLRLVMAGLNTSGLDVQPPGDDKGCQLAIACPGARCALAVSDNGDAEWEYRPTHPADPDLAADLTTVLLTGQTGPQLLPGGRPGRHGTFTGIVGRQLRGRGLDVKLAVFPDDDFLDAHSEIVATSPTTSPAARVIVTDDGSLTWIREHHPWAPARHEPGTCPGAEHAAAVAVAAAVVERITQTMSLLRQNAQAQPT